MEKGVSQTVPIDAKMELCSGSYDSSGRVAKKGVMPELSRSGQRQEKEKGVERTKTEVSVATVLWGHLMSRQQR